MSLFHAWEINKNFNLESVLNRMHNINCVFSDSEKSNVKEYLLTCTSYYSNEFYSHLYKLDYESEAFNNYCGNLFSLVKEFNHTKINSEIYSRLYAYMYRGMYRRMGTINWKYIKAYKLYLESIEVQKKHLLDLAKVLAEYYVYDANHMSIIEHFFPNIIKNMSHFVSLLYSLGHKTAKMHEAAMMFSNLSSSKDKKLLTKNIRNLLLKRKVNSNNTAVVAVALKNEKCLNSIKDDYDPEMKARLLAYLYYMGHRHLECNKFQIIKNVLAFDPTLVDDIQNIYIKTILNRSAGFKVTNHKKVISFLTTIPGAKPKFAFMQIHNAGKKMNTNHLVRKFPELKQLSILI